MYLGDNMTLKERLAIPSDSAEFGTSSNENTRKKEYEKIVIQMEDIFIQVKKIRRKSLRARIY